MRSGFEKKHSNHLWHIASYVNVPPDPSQEWKAGNHTALGSQVRPYEPRPPVNSTHKELDPSQFPLRLVKLDVDMSPGLKGWQKYKISIPPVIRARYIDDQVYGEDWKKMLKDFDTKHFVYILHQIIFIPWCTRYTSIM